MERIIVKVVAPIGTPEGKVVTLQEDNRLYQYRIDELPALLKRLRAKYGEWTQINLTILGSQEKLDSSNFR